MGNSVKVTIISEFDSWGALKAQTEMNKTAASIQRSGAAAAQIGDSAGFEKFASKAKSGARAVGNISLALGDEKGGAATMARMAGGALGAFATGGWAGLIVSGAAAIVSHFVQAKQAAVEAAAKIKAAFQAGLVKSFESQLKSTKKEYEELNKELDISLTRIDKLAAANDRLNKASSSARSAQAEDTAKNSEAGYSTAKRYGNNSPEELAVMSAQEKLDLIRLSNEESITAAQTEVTNSERAAAIDAARLAGARERLRLAEEQLGIAQDQGSRIPKGNQWDNARSENSSQVSAAQNDIDKAKTEIDAGAIAVQSAEFDLQKSTIKLHTARTAAAMRENDGKDAMDDLNKGIAKRAVVQERLRSQEARLERATAIAAMLQEQATFKNNYRNQSVAGGAAGFHSRHVSAMETAKEQEKANEKEDRWAKNAARKQAAGTKLSERDRQRLQDNKEFNQLRNRGGNGPDNLATLAAKQVAGLQKNLAELQKLNANLEANLKVQ